MSLVVTTILHSKIMKIQLLTFMSLYKNNLKMYALYSSETSPRNVYAIHICMNK